MLRPPDTQTVHPVLHHLLADDVGDLHPTNFFLYVTLYSGTVYTRYEERGARLELVPLNY